MNLRGMSKYEHIIWDWNGTIVDDARLCLGIYNAMARGRGLAAVSFDEYIEQLSFPVIDFYVSHGWDFEKLDFREVGAQFIGMYNAMLPENPLHADILPALEFLRGAGVTCSVLSAHQNALLNADVRRFGLGGYFSRVDGMSNIYGNSKAQLGLAHIQKLGVEPRKAVMLGDTVHDCDVAKAMGADCALIARGHNSRGRLERTGARVFGSVAEFMAETFNV